MWKQHGQHNHLFEFYFKVIVRKIREVTIIDYYNYKDNRPMKAYTQCSEIVLILNFSSFVLTANKKKRCAWFESEVCWK